MSFDDDDKKIRRNLVAFSVAVIASAFFQISFIDFFKALMPEKLGGVPVWKTLVAGLAVLIYFLIRYRWSEPYDNYQKKYRSAMADHALEIRKKYVTRLAERFNSKKVNWVDSWFFPSLVTAPQELKAQEEGWLKKEYTRAGGISVRVEAGPFNYINITHTQRYTNGVHGMEKTDSSQINQRVPRLQRAIEYLRVRHHAIIYSQPAVDVALPQIFALVALIILVYKVISAYAV